MPSQCVNAPGAGRRPICRSPGAPAPRSRRPARPGPSALLERERPMGGQQGYDYPYPVHLPPGQRRRIEPVIYCRSVLPTRLLPNRPPMSTSVFRCYCVFRMKVLDFVQFGGLGSTGKPVTHPGLGHRPVRPGPAGLPLFSPREPAPPCIWFPDVPGSYRTTAASINSRRSEPLS